MARRYRTPKVSTKKRKLAPNTLGQRWCRKGIGWPRRKGTTKHAATAIPAAVMARGDSLLPEDLPAEVREPKPVAPADAQSAVNAVVTGLFALARQDPKLKVIPAVERELIVRALAETGGNQVQAAKLLGITRATLRKRLEKFGILRKLEVK